MVQREFCDGSFKLFLQPSQPVQRESAALSFQLQQIHMGRAVFSTRGEWAQQEKRMM